MKHWGMWLIDLYGEPVNGWLERYEPELTEEQALLEVETGYTGPGGGLIVMTRDPKRAKQFKSPLGVLTEWKRQSKRQPYRPDGEPNRPLSAFTISPMEIPE